jgi:AraC-like DNA-binding protein
MFTLRGTPWQTKVDDVYIESSRIGLWGQILKPLAFRVVGESEVFGIRFYPSTASFLLHDDVSMFNDHVLDLTDVAGNPINELNEKLQTATSVSERIKSVETYLLARLSERPKISEKIELVRVVMDELTRKDFFDNIGNVANRYGISSRYLQKIFVLHTGLSPKLYSKINRFQNSLILMSKGDMSLTSVAYASGYFDQSHFIREFRSFTGFSPSGFNAGESTAILASSNK